MSQQVNIQDSLVVNPSGIDTSQSSYSTGSNNANAYTDTSSTTYSTLTCNTGSGATSYVTYTFDVSALPEAATIDSVTCTAKARISSTSYISTATLQLYSDTTAKGSTTSFRSTSTSTVYTLTPGTWTKSELANIRIRATATRGTSNTTRAAYIYFYGANLTINYSISGTQYTLTATSEINGVTVDPIISYKMGGESETFTIALGSNSIDDITVTDNDTDVTSSLVQYIPSGDDSVSETAESFTTEISGSDGQFYTSSSSTGNYFSYAVGHTAESPEHTAASATYVKDGSNNTATGFAIYSFDFSSIPSDATIDSVQVKCYGFCESTTHDSTHKANITLRNGPTTKSTEQYFTNTSNSIITITDPGTWTRAELQNAKLYFEVAYYGGGIFGITWTVNYSVNVSGTYYHYTLTNIAADHEIVISQAGAFIPPEEDPEKTYYPITISSINAVTSPSNGTTRVEAGTTETITITPTDPQLTLALDNGVDITSQLQGGAPDNTYNVTTASGASYGFSLNGSGYYESTNQGQSNSAAVARVSFNLETDCTVTFSYINYAESTYDYGIFGQIDTALGTTYTADSNAYLSCSTSSYNTSSVQTITYQMDAGSHYIDVKYRKDSSQDSNNDSLQFKVELTATGAGGDYTYTLSNISQKHSLIFIFGDVSYYFITSSGTNAKLYPDGQVVVLQGDNYHITIVPNNANATVSLTDNGTNVTSSLVYEEGQDKSGNTVANYTYYLTNVSAAHTLVATCASSGESTIYVKINGSWTPFSKIYVKVNDSWVEQSNSTWENVFDSRTNYRLIQT